MSLRFSDVKTYVTAGLTALGYGDTPSADRCAMPLILPGPPTSAQLQDSSPGPILFLQVGNGPGMSGGEGQFDGVFVVARTIGPQHDYDLAETLMLDVDGLLDVGHNVLVGNTRALYITRLGRPQLIDFDAADRYQFQGTYTIEAEK